MEGDEERGGPGALERRGLLAGGKKEGIPIGIGKTGLRGIHGEEIYVAPD